ncbi:DNA polymerase subunit gamma-1, mitochondrial isoform X2 [Phymastichus coffea]|uniref:DNA polymerase subunit gamma-1, mitochondrial isoform X2 n=1 Tax=Phymastichus coffea TaxID=108790 RepID=UPI00273B66E5|nr:DNA polymerase subunit gamma-1, mitochondrial isoform X2 [Phymastichus coffea]
MEFKSHLFSCLKFHQKLFKACYCNKNGYCTNNKLNHISMNETRFNEMNLQMLPISLYKKIFGDVANQEFKNNEDIQSIKSELKKFGIYTENNKFKISDININIPDLKGLDIEEHFKQIALEQIYPYRSLIENFKDLPPMPESFNLEQGWVRYLNPGYELVEYPREQELILDVEICLKNGPLPVLAIAVSTNSWYSWVSKQLIEGNCSSFMNKTLTPDLLIPLESSNTDSGINLSQFQLMPKIVIGHNVSFDRVRIKEQYWINKTATKFLDTMSLHVCISGTSSYQRSILRSKSSCNMSNSKLHNLSSLNNLSDVYKLYCGIELDKTVRNIFIDGDIFQIKKEFNKLMFYCASDITATHSIFKKMLPIFTERFPHPATLAESKICLSRQADQTCRLMIDDQYKKDPWMWDQNWKIKDFKLKSNIIKNVDSCVINIHSIRSLEEKFDYLYRLKCYIPKKLPHIPGYPDWYRKLFNLKSKPVNLMPVKLNISTSMLITPKLLGLKWEQFPLHHIKQYGWGFSVPDGNYNLFMHSITEQTNSSINTKQVACNKFNEMNSSESYDMKNMLSYSTNYTFFKLPHKDGLFSNVGNPLAKDFINIFSEKKLIGINRSSSRIIEIARMSSYWKNNRDRILSQTIIWLDNSSSKVTNSTKVNKKLGNIGILLPQVIVAGTVTRRAVESTWMTASNAQFDRIGSELRAMINAPQHYNIVGADVDSQELWIASIIGDSFSNLKIHGATPFSWMTLIGNKSSGTDMHSITAKAIGISRDQAKVINYARIYGAGQKFAERLLKQFNPLMTDENALKKSRKMFLMTKGERVYHLKQTFISKTYPNKIYTASDAFKIAKLHRKSVNELFKQGKWFGGTESAMFNSLESIAKQENPKTPFLNARLSRALEKEVSYKYLPTKINWVVQSAAVDFLHLILVSMRWLMQDQARLCLSFHDEVRYLVPSKYKYNAALALHVTNLLVRCFFVSKLGMKDLPMSVAFFTSVEIDTALRKEANQDYITPSNPHGLREGYGINCGESINVWDATQKSNGLVGIHPTSNKKI